MESILTTAAWLALFVSLGSITCTKTPGPGGGECHQRLKLQFLVYFFYVFFWAALKSHCLAFVTSHGSDWLEGPWEIPTNRKCNLLRSWEFGWVGFQNQSHLQRKVKLLLHLYWKEKKNTLHKNQTAIERPFTSVLQRKRWVTVECCVYTGIHLLHLALQVVIARGQPGGTEPCGHMRALRMLNGRRVVNYTPLKDSREAPIEL